MMEKIFFFRMDKFFRFTIIFLGTYLLLLWVFPPEKKEEAPKNDIVIIAEKEIFTEGNLVKIVIENNTQQPLNLGKGTPPEKMKISMHQNGQWVSVPHETNDKEQIVEGKSTRVFSFPEANEKLFAHLGKYEIAIQTNDNKEFSTTFEVKEPGFWTTIWRVFFWKPIHNALIFFLDISWGNLGIAIILLTIIVKLLLFVPTQNAMKSQRKMQVLQPELQEIRKKYAGDQQKIATESMQLWKKHNVNPFAAIIPILLQFPVLIALFYVVREGLLPNNHYFLYTPLKDFDFSKINFDFFHLLQLDKAPADMVSMMWLPLLVGVTQFFAMKLSFARTAKENAKNPKPKAEGLMGDFQEEMQKMNKVFVWVIPVMVAFFTINFPTAVGLYWLFSTIFTIGQQVVVNKTVK